MSEAYVSSVLCAWTEKKDELVVNALKSPCVSMGNVSINRLSPDDISSIFHLEAYLTVAERIRGMNIQDHEIYADVRSYFEDENSDREFRVVCCPSLTGKTQFAFTLEKPTIYIPLATGQKVYQPFYKIYDALRIAALEDLAQCYTSYLAHIVGQDVGKVVFDPAVSASNIITLLRESGSYVLGLFKLLQSWILNSTNAVESTKLVVEKMKSLNVVEKINRLSLAEFEASFKESPFIVALDEFPSHGIEQLIALFIRNILRSRGVKLFIMSTSSAITNMVSPGKTIQMSSGGTAAGPTKWATLYRRLPPPCIVAIFERYKCESQDDFMRKISEKLILYYSCTTSINVFIKILEEQFETSRPGLIDIATRAVLAVISTDERNGIRNMPFGLFVKKFILRLNKMLKGRKGMMFEYPGFVASINLAFPDSKIEENLLGPTSSTHINNHLYFLADPRGINQLREGPVGVEQESKFITSLYLRKNKAPSNATRIIDPVAYNIYDDDDDEFNENPKYLASVPGLYSNTEGSASGGPTVEEQRAEVAVHSAESPDTASSVSDAMKVSCGITMTDSPLYTRSECSSVYAGFKAYSEMPSSKNELFSFLGCWGCGNLFTNSSDQFTTFLPSVEKYIEEYIGKLRIGTSGNRKSPPNDGVIAESLAIESLIFSSHFIDFHFQNGLAFFHRLLRNSDCHSSSTAALEYFSGSEGFKEHCVGDGMVIKNLSIDGVSGEMIIESDILAEKLGNIRIPYLGPIDDEAWSEYLNQLLPNTFGNVYRPPSATEETGLGMDFQFEYFDGIEEVKKRAQAEVKDYREKVGVTLLRDVLFRIGESAEIHFFFCGPVTETLKNSDKLTSQLQKDRKDIDALATKANEVKSNVNQKRQLPHDETDEKTDSQGTESELSSGENINEPKRMKKSVPKLVTILESKKINLYYANRKLHLDGTCDLEVITLYETNDGRVFSIIVPFIPKIMENISTSELADLIKKNLASKQRNH